MQNMSADGGLCWEYSSYEVRDFWPKFINFNLAADLRELGVSDLSPELFNLSETLKDSRMQQESSGGGLCWEHESYQNFSSNIFELGG